jgi:hypothetical protein
LEGQLQLSIKKAHLWLLFGIFVGSLLASGCAEPKRIVTVEQVDEMIRKQVQAGSSKAEVVAFLDSLRIDSFEITHSDRFYGPEYLGNFDDEKADPLRSRLKEFCDAAVHDIAPSSGTFTVFIHMRFYFDEKGNLLDYSVKEDSGFR